GLVAAVLPRRRPHSASELARPADVMSASHWRKDCGVIWLSVRHGVDDPYAFAVRLVSLHAGAVLRVVEVHDVGFLSADDLHRLFDGGGLANDGAIPESYMVRGGHFGSSLLLMI